MEKDDIDNRVIAFSIGPRTSHLTSYDSHMTLIFSCCRDSVEIKVKDSCLECHKLEHSAAEDSLCREGSLHVKSVEGQSPPIGEIRRLNLFVSAIWLPDHLTLSSHSSIDNIISRVFIKSSALKQVVAIHLWHGCKVGRSRQQPDRFSVEMYQFEEMIHVKYTEAKSSPKGVAWKFKEKSGPLRVIVVT
ncbi:hypothetical protein TNCV_4405941 [Trichonephila clavipes]|uniref:Uncharacterized protein n=1 Tax=Trichonephila clavipes TaxID=2585209 RepID=A0A8X6VAZ8_TRICX|nr:hypothetical protein TNCV_4405941 [Trichonephila clavipes]